MALSSFRNPKPDAPVDPAAVSSTSVELDVFDVDLLSEAVAGSGLEHRQLGRGPFRGQLKRLRLGELLLDSGCYNQALQSRGCFAPGAVVLGCILAEREAAFSAPEILYRKGGPARRRLWGQAGSSPRGIRLPSEEPSQEGGGQHG